MPEWLWRELRPITPGKILGLEAVRTMIVAERRLNTISDTSVAFSGGPDAKRHLEILHEQREAVLRLSGDSPAPVLPPGVDPDEAEAQEKLRVFERRFAAAAAMFGQLPSPRTSATGRPE